jgi:phage gp36-like protein
VFALVQSSTSVAIWLDNVLHVRKDDVSKSVKSFAAVSSFLRNARSVETSSSLLQRHHCQIEATSMIRRRYMSVSGRYLAKIRFLQAVTDYPMAVDADLRSFAEPALHARHQDRT